MSLLTRLWNILRGKAHSALNEMEDPEASINLAIKDMTREIGDFRDKVASALVDQKKLKGEFENAVTKVKEWHRHAEAAVRSGDDNLAREALKQKAEAEALAKTRFAAMEQHNSTVVQLKDNLRELMGKRDDAVRRRNLLVARAKSAAAKKKAAEALEGTEEAGAFARFDELEARVEQLEMEASAAAEMMGEVSSLGSGDLEARFKALESGDPAIEDALRQLKSRTLPDAAPPAQLGPASESDDDGSGGGKGTG